MKKIALLLISIFMFAEIAAAADSVSFGISCVIPAIPGVNAPVSINEAKDKEQDKNTREEEKQGKNSQIVLAQEKSGNNLSPFILQEEISKNGGQEKIATLYQR